MNLYIGQKLFQVVWWGWDHPWHVGYWRWPNLENRLRGESVTLGAWMNFGFHGVYIGPIEFRYHPRNGAAR